MEDKLKSVFISVLLLSTLSAQAIVHCRAIPERIKIKNDNFGMNVFTTTRNLWNYHHDFAFSKSLSIVSMIEQLPEGSILIDSGAGKAQALVEALKLNPKIALGLAISYKRPDVAHTEDEFPDGRFQYKDGDYIENMHLEGKLDPFLGKASLLLDEIGPGSYSVNLPPLFQIYFDLLKKDGVLAINFMIERNYIKSGPSSFPKIVRPYLVNTVKRGDQVITEGILVWLKTIPGIEIVEVAHAVTNDGAYWEKSMAIKIRKISQIVQVPNTLLTVEYVGTSPAKRVFELISGANPTAPSSSGTVP